MNVVGDAALVQEPIELLVVNSVRPFEFAVQMWRPWSRSAASRVRKAARRAKKWAWSADTCGSLPGSCVAWSFPTHVSTRSRANREANSGRARLRRRRSSSLRRSSISRRGRSRCWAQRHKRHHRRRRLVLQAGECARGAIRRLGSARRCPGPLSLPDAAAAVGWAHAARKEVRAAVRNTGARRVHLFMSAPAGAALLLGHIWNRVGTTVYEDLSPGYASTFEIPG